MYIYFIDIIVVRVGMLGVGCIFGDFGLYKVYASIMYIYIVGLVVAWIDLSNILLTNHYNNIVSSYIYYIISYYIFMLLSYYLIILLTYYIIIMWYYYVDILTSY